MKKTNNQTSLLLLAALVLMGCNGSEDIVVQPPNNNYKVWQVVGNATQGDIVVDDVESEDGTRAAFAGGNTDRFAILWDQGDMVDVYQGDTKVGTLTPTSSSYGTAYATLSGTLEGSFSVGDELTLYLNGRSVDFTGQNGSLQSISSKAYAMKNVSVLTMCS